MRALAAVALAVLLSGCVLVEEEGGDDDLGDQPRSSGTGDGGSGSGPGQGLAPQQGTANGSRDGIRVDVRWRACEAGFCANATATNNGPSTVRVSSICESPWTDRMERGGRAVQHRDAQVMCMAYGRADFGPGDVAHADFTWDQRLWSDGTPRPAPEGAYTWTIAFWWEPKEGQPRREAAADIHLVVGAT